MYCSFRKAELFGLGYCLHGWQDATVKAVQVGGHLQLRIMSDMEILYFLEMKQVDADCRGFSDWHVP
jgi:hypothetical protein